LNTFKEVLKKKIVLFYFNFHLFLLKKMNQIGVQINLMVGIDFTASNGNPAQPGTLHYTGSNKKLIYL
jgi:hypothetical protein